MRTWKTDTRLYKNHNSTQCKKVHTYIYTQSWIFKSNQVNLWRNFKLTAFVSEALKDLHVKVPEAVQVGDDVTLLCDYDLENVALYSIRWYRYEIEFYRYLPKESPPTKVFPVKHVQVDVSSHKTLLNS